MKRNLDFVCKKYSWGWSVWTKVDKRKTLLANKLKSEYDVYRFVYSLDNKGEYKVIA